MKVGDTVKIGRDFIDAGEVGEIVEINGPWIYVEEFGVYHRDDLELVEESNQWDFLEDTLEYEVPKTVLTPRGKKTEWVKREEATKFAKKNDKKDDKAPLEYLRLDGISEMCEVFAFGANKYGKDNYLLGHHVDQLTAAALRHILAYQAGQELDPETGKSHIAHAQATLAMLQTQKTLGTLRRDDEA